MMIYSYNEGGGRKKKWKIVKVFKRIISALLGVVLLIYLHKIGVSLLELVRDPKSLFEILFHGREESVEVYSDNYLVTPSKNDAVQPESSSSEKRDSVIKIVLIVVVFTIVMIFLEDYLGKGE